MEKLRFNTPWHNAESKSGLENQLYKEVGKGHILFGKKVKSIATRQDCDDVLFEIEGFESKYAIVHLTWTQTQLADINWPQTELYSDQKEVQFAIDNDVKDWIEYENTPVGETGGFIQGKKRIIIVGASSGIGRKMAEEYALNGNLVAITGRRTEMLEELSKSFAGRIIYSAFDVTKDENKKNLEELVKRLNGLDLLIISAGCGEPSEKLKWEIDKPITDTNVMGFVEIANWTFNYFAAQGHGHLVTISSIAANRGSSYSPAYAASKSFQSTYFEGLSLKAGKNRYNIAVTCIEPGFVDTKMAKGGDKMFWIVPVEKAARQIIQGIKKRKRKVYVSRRWWLIAKIMRFAPYWLYRRFG